MSRAELETVTKNARDLLLLSRSLHIIQAPHRIYTRKMQCKASMALLLAVGPCLALALNIPPVQWPPEGFKADKVPQFILFS